MMKKLLSIMVLGLILSSNAYAGLLNFGFSDKLKKISPGDNPSKVEKKLGKPDGFKVRGEFTIYHYNHKLISEWAWDRADYHIIFKDNKVTEYGMGEVRQKDIGGVQTFFIYAY
jgi:hypothetical protein